MPSQSLATRSPDGYKEAERTARDFVCGDCAGELVVKRIRVVDVGGAEDRWVAICAADPAHTSILSRTDQHAAEIRERINADPRLAQALAIQGARVPLTTQAIRELDSDKLLARVPDRYGGSIEVSKQQKTQLAQLARIYGLDPLWDLMIYEGRPYVTYEGRLRKLREAPGYQGHRVRPLNAEEKELWGYAKGDLVIQCDINMGAHGVVTDWGVVRAAEISGALEKARRDNKKPAPVGSHQQQIALKRAIGRASRQAVGIDLPTWDGGQILDAEVREIRPPAPAEDEARALRRFWAVAKAPQPDGLGLDEQRVHELLKVETLTGYPGGYEQALSDLTEAAADVDQLDAIDETEREEPPPDDATEEAAPAEDLTDLKELAEAEAAFEAAEAPDEPRHLVDHLRKVPSLGEVFTCQACGAEYGAARTKSGVVPARLWLEDLERRGYAEPLCVSCARAVAHQQPLPPEAAG